MIAIIAAIQAEIDALLKLLKDDTKCTLDGISFWQGHIGEMAVVLMQSGVGKVNAAMSTTLLIKHYAPEVIVNIGTAGGLCEDEQIFDLVIADQVVQYDFDTSYVDGAEGIGRFVPCDKALCMYCEAVCKALKMNYHTGLIASGDQFVGRDSQLRALLQRFPKAKCAEMEAGAIAQVCAHFAIPFAMVRSLSDIAFQEKSNLSFWEYAEQASKRSAAICAALIQAWSDKQV